MGLNTTCRIQATMTFTASCREKEDYKVAPSQEEAEPVPYKVFEYDQDFVATGTKFDPWNNNRPQEARTAALQDLHGKVESYIDKTNSEGRIYVFAKKVKEMEETIYTTPK